MKKTFFICGILSLLNILSAQEGELFKQYEAAREIKASDVSTTPQLAVHAFPSSHHPKVNVVTGEYVEQNEDLIVAGIQPISFRRFYHHFSPIDCRFGAWHINPETELVANFGWDELEQFASVGEKNGSIIRLDVSNVERLPKHLSKIYDVKEALAFSLIPSHRASYLSNEHQTQIDPLNINTFVWKKSKGNEEKFAWVGIIQDGTGRVREFASASHEWHNRKTLNLDPSTWKGDFSPDFWIPYCIPVQKEILPNGNIIRYEYTKWREDRYFPSPHLLSSIKVYSHDEKVLMGKLDISYEKYKWKHEEELTKSKQGTPIKYREIVEDVASCKVTGSDKRSAYFTINSRIKPDVPILLQTSATAQQNTKYGYLNHLLNEVDKGNGRVLKTDYDPSTFKVRAQYAPCGRNGEMLPVARFVYEAHATIVYDAENNPTIYRFDDKKRVTAVEKYLNNALYSIERTIWNDAGYVESQSVEDAAGNTFQKTAFKYDSKGNILEKTESGFAGDDYTVAYAYSKDHLNLKITEKEGKKETKYTYKPNTNLIASEIVYEGTNIRKRTFYTYDNCAICIKKVLDDGKSLDEADLKGVTTRFITYTKPRYEFPCFGLAETVEEKTIDGRGNELLLSKVVYAYHPSGQIEREDHYDADNVIRFSLHNTYDEKERLKKATNALHAQLTYEYDKNNNLVAKRGPKLDVQWEYDKMNHPIMEKKGECITRKKYDRLGRVVEEIDACQNTTKTSYDALGRVLQITYPDGGVKKKEYDILGNVIKETDQNGHSIGRGYNFRGQVTHVFFPDGSGEHFVYNPNGTLKEHTDKNGVKTVYTYNIFDCPIKTETFVNGKLLKSTTATYSTFCKLSETDAEGVTTTYAYDFAGRKISEKKGERETKYFYDTLGYLTRTQQEDVNDIEEFDLLGRLIEKRTEDSSGMVFFKENYAYDENGNRTHIITSEGITEMAYNAQNLPVKITNPEGHTTTISYSYNKLLTKITINPEGVQTIETYNPCGRLQDFQVRNVNNEIIQHRAFLYDLAGNRIHHTENVYSGTTPIRSIQNKWEYGPFGKIKKYIEASVKETEYLYDTKGRLTTIVKPDGVELYHAYDDLGRLCRLTSSKKDINHSYSYDKNDRLISLNSGFREYDVFGNLTKEKLENGYLIKNTYDAFGKRKRLTLPDGSKVHYTYRANKLYDVTYNDLTYTISERNLSGMPTEIQLPNDLGDIQLTYDACLRLKKINSPYFKAAHHYGQSGCLTQYASSDALGIQNITYTYDDLKQLLSENEQKFAYDSIYNQISPSHKVNELCQLLHDGTKEYEYDANGNLIKAGNINFSYDSLDRLIKIQTEKHTYEYVYDGLNRCMMEKRPSLNVHYIWDDTNEIGSSNSELRIPGENFTCFMVINKKTYIPVQDYKNSIVTLLNLEGTPVETYRYTYFGKKLTPNHLSPWQFMTTRLNEETGMNYIKRQYYLSEHGRWLTPQPNQLNPYTNRTD